ncbi:MAG: hypothetical protein RSA66_09455 [Muribaculaceae bacterium]
MKKIKYIISFLVIAMLLGSCTKDNIDNEEHGEMIKISYSITGSESRASEVHPDDDDKVDTEYDVQSIRMYFFDQATHKLVTILKSGDADVQWSKASHSITFPGSKIDKDKTYDLEVLANVSDDMINPAGIAVGISHDDFKKKYSIITGKLIIGTYNPIIMSDNASNINLKTNSNITLGGFTRQIVKFNIEINITNSINFDRIEFSDLSFTIMNVPSYSTLRASDYGTITGLSGFKLIDYASENLVSPFDNKKWYSTTYIYAHENPITSTTTDAETKATYLIINAPYKNIDSHKEVTENYYKIMIKSPTQDTGISEYGTVRNHNYKILVNINGFGKDVPTFDGIDVITSVLPWNYVASNPDKGGFITYQKIVDANNNELKDESNLPDIAQDLQVSYNTNIGGWHVEVRDKDGNIYYKSAKVTAPANHEPTTKTITIPIKKISAQNVEFQEYTIKAVPEENENAMPQATTVKLVQIPGLIPNSALTGWPASADRPRGIQVARRGNINPAIGSYENECPGVPFSSGYSTIPSSWGLSTQLGQGKNNKDIMNSHSLGWGEGPNNRCSELLGTDWYVPSVEESIFIVSPAAIKILGGGYFVVGVTYWSSSSDATSGLASAYTIDSGGATATISTPALNTALTFRCIRNI